MRTCRFIDDCGYERVYGRCEATIRGSSPTTPRSTFETVNFAELRARPHDRHDFVEMLRRATTDAAHVIDSSHERSIPPVPGGYRRLR